MNIRIPGWLESTPRIRVNGQPRSETAKPGAFATIKRKWKNHDTVEVTFPMQFRTQAVDDAHSKLVAFMRGPLMYVAVNPPAEIGRLDTSQLLSKLTFRPFYQVTDETYNTYFQI